MIEKFINHMKVEGLSNNTIRGAISTINTFRRFTTDVKRASRDEILNFVHESDKKPRTLSNRYTHLHRYYTYLQEEGLILQNPMEHILAPKLPLRLPSHVLTEGEAKKLIQSFEYDEKKYIPFRNHLMAQVMFCCSLRRSELVALDKKDYDPHTLSLRVTPIKTKIGRITPVSESVAALLNQYLEFYPIDNNVPLFRNYRNERISTAYITNMVRKARKAIKLRTKASSHSFRKTSATLMLKNGAPLVSVKRLLGHSRIESTTIYTKVYPKDIIKMHGTFHPRERQKNIALPKLKVPSYLYTESLFK